MILCRKWYKTFLEFFGNNRYIQKCIIIFWGLLLVIIYGSKITSINTVWELGDEAGYLCNAAYFAGSDWSDVAASLPYFGYGYSVILVPLFFLCKNGIELIHGAIFVNTICLLLSYFIQISVMQVVCDECSKAWLAFFAFIVSMAPYLASNTLKVLCEVFLTMWVWLIAYVLTKVFKNRTTTNFILLGLVTGYIFFIHTRAIVVVGTVWLIIGGFFLGKRVNVKELVSFVIPFMILTVVLYMIKNNIITSSMQIAKGDARENINMIGGNYLLLRLKWLFADFYLYVISFTGKVLYLIASTGGMILFGITAWIKGIRESYSDNDDNKLILYLYIGAIFFFMLVACVLNGAGTKENFTYIFYSRYYEFTIFPMVFLGLYTSVSHRKNYRTYVIYCVVTIIAGLITLTAHNVLLESDEVHMDTARIPGFTYLVLQDSSFTTFIMHTVVYSILIIMLFAFFQNTKKLRSIIPILVLGILLSNSNKCMDKVLSASNNAFDDVQLAEYVMEQIEEDEVIFVDSDFKWSCYYSRMQVLLKEKKLTVIPEERAESLEKGKFYLTYLSSKLGIQLENEGKLLKKGSVFGVYSN